MNSSDNILHVSDLKITFDDVVAVDGLSFELSPGKTLGIVGESGSGKSVTAMAIMGLIDHMKGKREGVISYHDGQDDVELTALPEKQMIKYRGQHIGLIFQEPFSAFNPSYTCGRQIKENVDLHLKLDHKAAKQLIFETLERVGLDDPQRIYDSYPHELSGGQLQRALIAMTVVCKPRIVIADEPTTALDVTVQQNVLSLFKEIVTDFGASLIFISHDLGVISEIADDVLVMYKGRKMEYGSTRDIFIHPKHPYTRGLLECRPKMSRDIDRLPVVADFMRVETLENGDWRTVEIETPPSYGSAAERKKSRGKDITLRVEDLEVKYPYKRNFWGQVTEYVNAVKGVSFDLLANETLGLVGESGSGKSSLGKAIVKLVDHLEGKVIYNDLDIVPFTNGQMRPLRKDIQMIFQDPYSTLNPRMKIGHAISEVLTVHKYRGDKRQRTLELLNKVGLGSEHFDRYPRQFSGGQRQRISIARTLAVEPKIVICDESVSALDVSVQAQILNLLNDLKEEFGMSYIFISHDLSVVKHMSDRMLVMKNGEIVESGYPEDIYSNPQHLYTKKLIQSIPGKDFK